MPGKISADKAREYFGTDVLSNRVFKQGQEAQLDSSAKRPEMFSGSLLSTKLTMVWL